MFSNPSDSLSSSFINPIIHGIILWTFLQILLPLGNCLGAPEPGWGAEVTDLGPCYLSSSIQLPLGCHPKMTQMETGRWWQEEELGQEGGEPEPRFGLDACWNPQANDRAHWLLDASLAPFPVPLAGLQVE